MDSSVEKSTRYHALPKQTVMLLNFENVWQTFPNFVLASCSPFIEALINIIYNPMGS